MISAFSDMPYVLENATKTISNLRKLDEKTKSRLETKLICKDPCYTSLVQGLGPRSSLNALTQGFQNQASRLMLKVHAQS